MNIDPAFTRSLLEDGVACASDLLDEHQLARLRACYDWSVNNPGPVATSSPEGDSNNMSWRDYGNPDAPAIYHYVIKTMPFPTLLKGVWDSEHLWYHKEEPFLKKGNSEGVPWHQDTAYTPWYGDHWVNCWMSFEALPRGYSIEVVRGSHCGPLYNDAYSVYKHMSGVADVDNPERPNIPDIESERKKNPGAWDIVSYDVEPGDVVFFHPACLHRGPPTDERVPVRSSLTFRFFGDRAYWSDVPESGGLSEEQTRVIYGAKRGKPGTPYRDSHFLQLY